MKTLYIIAAALTVCLLVGGLYFYFAHLQPITGMQPTGKYNVGTTNFDYEFESKHQTDARKLNIKAWYPTNANSGELDLQQTPKTAMAVTKNFGIPEFLASSDKSASYIDVPIASDEASYPVIIFNHGFASFHTQNTVNVQELASHGYIVLSIAHPNISLMTEYTDGTFVAHDADHPAYKSFASEVTELQVIGKQLKTILKHAENINEFEAYWQVMAEFSDMEIYDDLKSVIEQWIEDTHQIVDLIAADGGLELSTAIGGFMSTDKIATFGHSLGGVTSTFANYTNTHIVAALNLDAPPIFTMELAKLNLDKPTCHLMSDVVNMGDNELDFRQVNRPALKKSTAFGCNAIFKGAAHMSFTDMNYVGVMKLMGQLGKVDQRKMGEELNRMILWYFDRMLKAKRVAYIPKHSEIVELEMFNESGK